MTTEIDITEPKGKRVFPSTLKRGKLYLYKGLYKYSKVIGLNEKHVHYLSDTGREGCCTRQHFVRTYPTELTKEEHKIIQKDWEGSEFKLVF